MKLITTYTELNRTFYIVKNEAGYWAIEDKYVDENGKLLKQFNGITGLRSDTVSECLSRTSTQIKVDYYISEGMTAAQASVYVITGKLLPAELLKTI